LAARKLDQHRLAVIADAVRALGIRNDFTTAGMVRDDAGDDPGGGAGLRPGALDAALAAGATARANARPRAACPHAAGSGLRAAWLLGYGD